MIALMLIAVAGIIAAGLIVALAIRKAPKLRTRLIILGVSATVLPVAAVLSVGLVMLDNPHDVAVLFAVGAASALTSAALAIFVAREVGRNVGEARDAAFELAAGNLDARIPEAGSAELRELGASFNQMAQTLGRLIETRRNLVAWASHDLRAPLAALQAMIEALEDGLGDTNTYGPEMSRQVAALSQLVDDLFELSRIETGTLHLTFDEISIAELAGSVVRSLQPQAATRGVRLTIESESVPHVRCSPDKIERLLMNLLVNALRHTPADGAIAVRVAAAEAGVLVAVEDTGTGLNVEGLHHAFDSFWRADKARTETGAGLGLAIAQGIIAAHGGTIWAENVDGAGARFAFTLPAA
ncbi:MAG: HAMP domain-containing sensor histidine kinase [Actinomycetota bacterium]